METVGNRFECAFNEFFNNQQTYKHRVDLVKSINQNYNSQNLNNLFKNAGITEIMIDICKGLKINLNYLVGLEYNKFINHQEKYYLNEKELTEILTFEPDNIRNKNIISITNLGEITLYQTSSINLYFINRKTYIVKTGGGLCGIAIINAHNDIDKLYVKFNINDNFITIEKHNIEIIAEQINNE